MATIWLASSKNAMKWVFSFLPEMVMYGPTQESACHRSFACSMTKRRLSTGGLIEMGPSARRYRHTVDCEGTGLQRSPFYTSSE